MEYPFFMVRLFLTSQLLRLDHRLVHLQQLVNFVFVEQYGIIFSSSQLREVKNSRGYAELSTPSKGIPSEYVTCNVALFVSSKPRGIDVAVQSKQSSKEDSIWKGNILDLTKIEIMSIKGIEYDFQPLIYDIYDEIEEERSRF